MACARGVPRAPRCVPRDKPQRPVAAGMDATARADHLQKEHVDQSKKHRVEQAKRQRADHEQMQRVDHEQMQHLMTSSPNQRRGGNYELDVHENRDEMKFLAGAATNARPHPNLRFLLPKAHLWGPAKDERRGKAMKGEGSEPMRALRARQGTVRCVCRGVMDL